MPKRRSKFLIEAEKSHGTLSREIFIGKELKGITSVIGNTSELLYRPLNVLGGRNLASVLEAEAKAIAASKNDAVEIEHDEFVLNYSPQIQSGEFEIKEGFIPKITLPIGTLGVSLEFHEILILRMSEDEDKYEMNLNTLKNSPNYGVIFENTSAIKEGGRIFAERLAKALIYISEKEGIKAFNLRNVRGLEGYARTFKGVVSLIEMIEYLRDHHNIAVAVEGVTDLNRIAQFLTMAVTAGAFNERQWLGRMFSKKRGVAKGAFKELSNRIKSYVIPVGMARKLFALKRKMHLKKR